MSSSYYQRLIFDNSRTAGSYQPSRGEAVAPSELALVDHKLPVTEEQFFSPPNSLRLAWRSRPGGDWKAELWVEPWRGRDLAMAGDTLALWWLSPTPIAAADLPMLQLVLAGGRRTRPLRLGPLAGDLPADAWRQVQIPLAAFDCSTDELDFTRLRRLIFSQGIDDGAPHTLYIDEVKLRERTQTAVPAGGDVRLSARGYERHVDLRWQPLADPAIAHYQILRAAGDGPLRPVGIQGPELDRYSDYIGAAFGRYRYRAEAVGHDGRAHAVSAELTATTAPMSDDALLDMVQEACLRLYWERAHPEAGMALECVPGDEHLVALGASGFGVLAMLAGAERSFVARAAVAERLLQIVDFLGRADRFHGAWPHFLDGRDGRAVALFGRYDNGGDLVESAFMAQGLLAARQYFDRDSPVERRIRQGVTALWESIEWDWYRRTPDGPALYWHWSPEHGWHIDHPLIGWNETMIVYLLAIASPTHPVPASLYYSGWAATDERAREYRRSWGKTRDGDGYRSGLSYYGLDLDVGVGSGGPLFFTHYSYLALDPRQITDRYTNYFDNNRALALINYRYCQENPGGHQGYGPGLWGLSACDDHCGYQAHDPTPKNDNGTIAPTAALASFPYTPAQSMAALKHLYRDLGARVWGIYGFRDAYNPSVNFVSPIFMGLNQAPITVMIENWRSGLLWRLLAADPAIRAMLEKLRGAR
ncbi:MAG: hypothetical protein HGA45_05585 [Chloroflexales bacterium]|nr:hypothetical protein [Chloroflexales bacterium]